MKKPRQQLCCTVKEKKRGETGRMTSVAELQLQCDRFAVPDVEADVGVGVRDLSLSLSLSSSPC